MVTNPDTDPYRLIRFGNWSVQDLQHCAAYIIVVVVFSKNLTLLVLLLVLESDNNSRILYFGVGRSLQ